MIQIANYSPDGPKFRVRLKCTCGAQRVLKVTKGDEATYQCANCGAQATLHSLKDEATMYWRGRTWEVVCEEENKVEIAPVQYPAVLEARERRFSPLCRKLTGYCTELSAVDLLFVAKDFKKEYFQELSAKKRFASVSLTKPVAGLPSILRGSIVEIKFRDEELPRCRIRVAFQNLDAKKQKEVNTHLEELLKRAAKWSAE